MFLQLMNTLILLQKKNYIPTFQEKKDNITLIYRIGKNDFSKIIYIRRKNKHMI